MLRQYSLRANLGTNENPCYISIPLLPQETLFNAYGAGLKALENCHKDICWSLMQEGHFTGRQIQTGPKPDVGTECLIHISVTNEEKIESVFDLIGSSIKSCRERIFFEISGDGYWCQAKLYHPDSEISD